MGCGIQEKQATKDTNACPWYNTDAPVGCVAAAARIVSGLLAAGGDAVTQNYDGVTALQLVECLEHEAAAVAAGAAGADWMRPVRAALQGA